MLQLILAQAVEEVGLVLVGITGSQQPGAPIGPNGSPRVVAGRHGLAVVQVTRSPQQRPEFDVSVAVDARRWCPTVEIGVQERLEHAGIEFALEVHHVERDIELGRDAPGIVGGVERAAALLELGVRVGDVVEAHPDPDHLVTLSVEQGGRNGRVHPARHRDQDPTHAGAPWPSGSAATAIVPIRIDATTPGTIAQARLISSSVVVRPSERRNAPRASSSG